MTESRVQLLTSLGVPEELVRAQLQATQVVLAASLYCSTLYQTPLLDITCPQMSDLRTRREHFQSWIVNSKVQAVTFEDMLSSVANLLTPKPER